MLHSQELSDCIYKKQPSMITPSCPTPKHYLYLSNLDDQKFLRFSIKYLYLFKQSVSSEELKYSLSKLLVDYYPLTGRLRQSDEDDLKLVVDCNGEGAVFAEAFMDITCDDFLGIATKPNRSFRKLLYKVDAHSFLDIPPLVVQVTYLSCGGMILCTAINHSLCDGIGTSQFLHAWAHLTRKPDTIDLPIKPIHSRHVLKPRCPSRVMCPQPVYTKPTSIDNNALNVFQYLQSQPLAPVSLTFTENDILRLKQQRVPSLKCTAFEALASHTWRSWVKSLGLSSLSSVKLLFSADVRNKLNIPNGFYGNGFVLACAESLVNELDSANLRHGVKCVQEAKLNLSEEYVRSMVDLLEDKTVKTDLTASLVISQWSRLGLEDLDFGVGKALHVGPLSCDIYCLFLPVMGDSNGIRVQLSMPDSVVEKFEYHMTEFLDESKDINVNGYQGK